MANLLAGQAYRRRQVPYVPKGENSQALLAQWAQKLVAWLTEELGYVQQATLRDTTRVVTADTTATVNDGTILADATLGPVAVTLPTAAEAMNVTLTIIKSDASGNAVTVVGTVSGAVDPALAARYDSTTIRSCGSGTSWEWIQVASA